MSLSLFSLNPDLKRAQLIEKVKIHRAMKRKIGFVDARPPFYIYVPCYERVFTNKDLKYILLKGGRGGAKTINTCQFLIDESFDRALKGSLFIFGREVQASVADSVYAVVKSLIEQAQLTPFFRITNTRIINRLTGVEFAFIGLRATNGRTAFSQVNKLKGKFNVKYVFIDEAQDLTEDTINVLFPTVNRSGIVPVIEQPWHRDKEESLVQPDTRLIFCMNPNREIDPIVAKIKALQNDAFNRNIKPNAVILHKNIFDLPKQFQDPQLLAEAESEKYEIYYAHVWLGKASEKLGGYPFSFLPEYYPRGGEVEILGAFLDPSFKGGDFTALSFLGKQGNSLLCWGKAWREPWNMCLDRIKAEITRTPPHYFWYEDNSLGTVPQQMLAQIGVNCIGHMSTGVKENRIFKSAAFVKDRMKMVVPLCNSAYITQTKSYSMEADNDDAPDSLASALIKCGIIPERIKF